MTATNSSVDRAMSR